MEKWSGLICKECGYHNKYNEYGSNCEYCGMELKNSIGKALELAYEYGIMQEVMDELKLSYNQIIVADWDGFRQGLNKKGINNRILALGRYMVNVIGV